MINNNLEIIKIKNMSNITITSDIKSFEDSGKNYIETIFKKGKSEWKILDFNSGYFVVYKSVNNKRSAIASKMGKHFHSWLELTQNYKSIKMFLDTDVKNIHFQNVEILNLINI